MEASQSRRRGDVLRSADVVARAEATRASLLAAARELFIAKGFFNTTTEEIVAAAGVGTRGALYHHFADKRALFKAVLHAIEDEMLASVLTLLTSANSASPVEQLKSGVAAFLQTTLTPGMQRVVLIEGPAVLGWHEWRTIEEEYGLGALQDLLRSAIAQEAMPKQPVEVVAHMIFAFIAEAALFIANSDQPAIAKDQAVTAADRLLSGLIAPAP